MKNQFLDAMNFRHACREFDPAKPVSEEELNYILEVGRLSPSSMGMEQWHFLVTRGEAMKSKLRAACWNQKQLEQASVVVVILAKTADIHPDAPRYREILHRRFGQKWEQRLAYYRGYYDTINVAEWSVAQCHIAAANMMTAAAFIGIDSCPVGGFEPEKLIKAVGADPARYAPAIVIPFGHRAKEPPPRNRLPIDELVTYID